MSYFWVSQFLFEVQNLQLHMINETFDATLHADFNPRLHRGQNQPFEESSLGHRTAWARAWAAATGSTMALWWALLPYSRMVLSSVWILWFASKDMHFVKRISRRKGKDGCKESGRKLWRFNCIFLSSLVFLLTEILWSVKQHVILCCDIVS